MTAENDVNSHLYECLHGTSSAEHASVPQPVWRPYEMVVGHQDASGVLGGVSQCTACEFDLMPVDLATGNRPVGSRRVERDHHCAIQLHHPVELRTDVTPVFAQRIGDSLPQPVERHVVVARYGESREVGQTLDEFRGPLKLLGLRTLCEVAAHDDGVGLKRRRNALKRISDAGQIRRPEVKVGYVK